MMHAIVPGVAVILCLALAGVVSYDLAPLVLKPRVRRPAVTANPGGPPPFPASGAAPATLAHLRRRMAGLPAHQRTAPVTAGWALAPVPSWGRDGANPYPADTLTDLPAIPAVRPYALAPVRADCPSSPTGGHCCHNDSGKWTCCLPGCPR